MATSNFRIKKICEWCGQEFVGQKVTTKYCSHRCANFAYKQAIRAKRVQQKSHKLKSSKAERILKTLKRRNIFPFQKLRRLLGLSRQAIYTMVKAGHLKASKIEQ